MSLHPDFVNDLRKRFLGDIRLDVASRILYSTDASMYQIEPLGVAIPRTQDDLHAAVELAAKHKIPILPRGAGSSLGGQAIGEALILDCSRWLDSVIEIDSESHVALVEPGVVLSTLNLAAAKYGLMFGPDPASAERATMGGVIGNNATGAHSILYGMSADHLVSADVILGDGSLETWDESNKSRLFPVANLIRERYASAIKRNFPKTWRNSAGYRLNYLLPWSPSMPPQWDSGDYGLSFSVYRSPSGVNLACLLSGSEGTLAVMRRAMVNLVPKPKHTILGVLAYPGIPGACDDVPRLLGFEPSAIELIPQMLIRLARSVPAYARQMSWIAGEPAAVLVVEFSGDRLEILKAAVGKIGDVLLVAESAEEQARVWNLRKMGLGILDSRPRSARPAAFIEDCAIPVERLSEFICEVERIMSAHDTEGGIYAHASAGCLHIRPILDLRRGEGVRALRSIGEQVFALTLRLGGSMSSEHGDGIVAGEWIERTYGAELTEAMRMLKWAADPHNLLNPHKMFDAPPMDTNLRFGEGYRAQAWASSLHFDHEHGLAGAIEHCNGQGVCRKTTGVMCPSYQAMREEMHSTRGRANLLRALIASPIPIGNGNSEIANSVHAALDLCLACKGCRSECPSGVDMAKLKYEFENQYFRSNRRALRDYAFGFFHVTAALLGSFAPLSNAIMQVPAFRKLSAKVLGITSARPFPRFTRPAVRKDIPAKSAADSGRSVIIYLSDPFSRYVEPQIEQAALEILSGCGFDVLVLPVLGSGVSMLSKGFVEAAKRHARRALDALNQVDPARKASVVGIEPPEIYTLKHDYLDLLPERREEILERAAKVWLLDEFLLRSGEFEELRIANLEHRIPTQANASKVKFHPHCHQRAEGPASDGLPTGSNATARLLSACGYDVEVLDAGCCGMAGTFGYEAEHYELSMKVGELSLFPSIREMGSSRDISVVASGVACRMQIEQGTGRNAIHPILLVGQRLFGS